VALVAARPATLGASLAPVAAATALAARDGGARWGAAGAALLGAVLIQLGTNLVNDAADHARGADGADRLGPPRAVAQGWLSRRAALGAAAAAFALALLPGAWLVAQGGWPILVLGLCSLASGWAYTAGPFPLAYLGLGEAFVLLFFGLGAVGGTYWVQRLALAPEVGLLGLAMGLFACGILAVNNLRDRAGDARAGKRTLAVRLGERFARTEHAACLLLPYALALGAWAWWGWRGWLVPLASLPLALLEVARVRRAEGRALNPHLAGAARAQLAFALLLGLGAAR
jgi:1,4-dihydroxy-2-naphthoate octaprenyltransferase